MDAGETIGNTTASVDISFGNNTNYTIFQSFPITKDLLNTVVVPLKKAGSPTDNIFAAVCDDLGNIILPSINSVNGASLTGSLVNQTFNFDYAYITHLKKTSNLLYIALFRDGSQDAVNYYTTSEQSTSYITTGQRYVLTTTGMATVSTSDVKWAINLANQSTAGGLRRLP